MERLLQNRIWINVYVYVQEKEEKAEKADVNYRTRGEVEWELRKVIYRVCGGTEDGRASRENLRRRRRRTRFLLRGDNFRTTMMTV